MKKLGFVIANGFEEFLADYSVEDGSISRAWALFPHRAKVFKTIEEADNAVIVLDSDYPLYVLGIKESKKQFVVYPPREGQYPTWLFE